MTSSSFPSPYSVGLCGDAALRYALVQMVVASPMCAPSAYLTTVEALFAFVKTAPVLPPNAVSMPQFSVSEAALRADQNAAAARMCGAVIGAGQTHTIRQEDQSRG